jgi:hypothetical protein
MNYLIIKCIKIVIHLFRQWINIVAPLPYHAMLLIGNRSQTEFQELILRFNKFYPDIELPPVKERLTYRDVVSGVPVLALDGRIIHPLIKKLNRSSIFYINPNEDPEEAWNWFRFLQCYHGLPDLNRRAESHIKLQKRVCTLKQLGLDRAYLLGTGQSLEKAIDIDFNDGYRIVCNTIVKDPDLWHHVKPHFIVAADAIYHFGPDDYAKAFRKDLHQRLSECDTFFIYPELFDVLVMREFSEMGDQLIPIPMGTHTEICCDLNIRFELPGVGNVLNHVLLPLGCTLSNNIYLWGFDGRAPDDKLFWANSNKHFYKEHMGALIAANPAFFEHNVPQSDPGKYARTVHGDHLEDCLGRAEQKGMRFVMMHFSWTQTLNKRFKSLD